MVSEHYAKLGFEKIDSKDSILWQLNVEDFHNKECCIKKK